MARQLPPLNALKAFEAAARNLSITKAARELNVSPGAISHQVRQLEEHFGVTLFLRLNRRIQLTSAGQACLPAVRDGFDRIEEAIRRLKKAEQPGVVTVSTEISFGERWLLPRLATFQQSYPQIDVRLLGRPIDAKASHRNSNIAIAHGYRRYQGLTVERLFSEQVLAVCSPDYRDKKRIREFADLRHAQFIHDETLRSNAAFPDWPSFLNAAGVHDFDATSGHRFSVASMAVEAARLGQGVALGRTGLVEDLLDQGELCDPLGFHYPQTFEYFVVGLPADLDEPRVAIFWDWLLDQAARYRTCRASADTALKAV